VIFVTDNNTTLGLFRIALCVLVSRTFLAILFAKR
jgi:hypothetical protein